MVQVCRKVNSLVPPNRFIASLSNGETIFQDVCEGKPNAWLRLKDYIKENNLRITQLRYQIKDREHQAKLSPNADGYVYLRKCISIPGQVAIMCYGIGHVENNEALILWQREDGAFWGEKRSVEKCGFGAIMNTKD